MEETLFGLAFLAFFAFMAFGDDIRELIETLVVRRQRHAIKMQKLKVEEAKELRRAAELEAHNRDSAGLRHLPPVPDDQEK